MELFVDFVVPTSSDKRRSEVPLPRLSDRRQAGCLQVFVEVLHLIRWLLWKEEDDKFLMLVGTVETLRKL